MMMIPLFLFDLRKQALMLLEQLTEFCPGVDVVAEGEALSKCGGHVLGSMTYERTVTANALDEGLAISMGAIMVRVERSTVRRRRPDLHPCAWVEEVTTFVNTGIISLFGTTARIEISEDRTLVLRLGEVTLRFETYRTHDDVVTMDFSPFEMDPFSMGWDGEGLDDFDGFSPEMWCWTGDETDYDGADGRGVPNGPRFPGPDFMHYQLGISAADLIGLHLSGAFRF